MATEGCGGGAYVWKRDEERGVCVCVCMCVCVCVWMWRKRKGERRQKEKETVEEVRSELRGNRVHPRYIHNLVSSASCELVQLMVV